EGESPERPSPVVRVTVKPPMVTLSLAWTVKVPGVGLLMVSVQVATLPLMLTRVGPLNVPGVPDGKVTVGVAKVGVPVAAGKAVTVMVKVSAWLISLTGVCGVMLIVASTAFCGSVPSELLAGLLLRSPL